MLSAALLLAAVPALVAAQEPSVNLVARASLTGAFGITGNFTFTYVPGQGTDVEGSVSGLSTNTSVQYPYHVHAAALNPSGNCSSALGHLDPLSVSDGFACGPVGPSLHWHCQEGDLSGKHGRLVGSESGQATVNFTDLWLRWSPQPFSLLGRSMVIHAPNGTRLACGNITSFADGTADAEGNPTNNGSTYQNAYPSAAPPPPAATLTPIMGTSTDSAIYSMMFIAASLPAVSETANIVLSTSVVPTSTINGTTFTSLTIPIAVAAASTSSGSASAASSGANAAAALPTQAPVTAPAAPTASQASANAGGAGGSSSPSRAGAAATGMPLLQQAGGLVAAAVGVVALL